MKKKILLPLILIANIVFGQINFPEQTHSNVNDFANVIPDDKEGELSSMIKNLETKSSIQLCIITTNDIPSDYDIQEYATALFNKWGIGQKGVDNGCLILISPNTRRSRVEVGFGLEGALTDAYTSQKQRELLIPNIKKGDYFTGIQSLVTDFARQLDPEILAQKKAYEEQKAKERKEAVSSFFNTLLWIIVFAAIGIFIYIRYKREQKEKLKKQEELKRLEIERLREEQRIKREFDSKTQSTKDVQNKLRDLYDSKYQKLQLLEQKEFQNAKEILKSLSQLKQSIDLFCNMQQLDTMAIMEAVIFNCESLEVKIYSLVKEIEQLYKIRLDVEWTRLKTNEIINNSKDDKKQCIASVDKIKSYSKNVWTAGSNNDNFDSNNYLTTLEDYVTSITNKQNEAEKKLNENDFNIAKSLSDSVLTLINKYTDLVSFIKAKPFEVYSSQGYIQTGYNDFNTLKDKISLDVLNNYVQDNTRRAYKNFISNLKIEYLINSSSTNPIQDAIELKNLMNTLQNHYNNIKKDIADKIAQIEAEERRKKAEAKRKKEQEEEDDRRRRRESEQSYGGGGISWSSPSGSDYSSTNSNTDFGGGLSGGGGSTESW